MPACSSAATISGPNGSARRKADSANDPATGQEAPRTWNSCSNEAMRVLPVAVLKSASACLSRLRGHKAQGEPSSSTILAITRSSGVAACAGQQANLASRSGTKRKSPALPQGLPSAIRSNGVSDIFAGTQPNVFLPSVASNALRDMERPRVMPAKSVRARVTSASAPAGFRSFAFMPAFSSAQRSWLCL